jgi:hypothetical protein
LEAAFFVAFFHPIFHLERSYPMSAYRPHELDQRWRQNQLTAEQAVGHLVQLLLELFKRLDELERRLRQVDKQSAP